MTGDTLRQLREAKGISRQDAAEVIRASNAKISRMELGRVGFRQRDVADLLTLYGVTDERERHALLALARQANAPAWWHQYGDVLPSWFETYVGVERAASAIYTYQMQFIPDLLQTEAYARAALMWQHPGESVDQITRRVRLRSTRQQVLDESDSPHLWVVLDEAVLWRSLGSRQLMQAQLRHLIALTERPNITVQVLPLRSGAHATAGGRFTILRFTEPSLPDTVYLEQLDSALYLTKKAEVHRYSVAMERLCAEADTLTESTRIIRTISNEL